MTVAVAYPALAAGAALLHVGASHARAAQQPAVLVHVAPLRAVSTARDLDRQTRRLESLEQFLEVRADDLRASGVECRVELLLHRGDDPADVLVGWVAKTAPRLLVVGRRPSVSGAPRPAGMHARLHSAPCPILSVPIDF